MRAGSSGSAVVNSAVRPTMGSMPIERYGAEPGHPRRFRQNRSEHLSSAPGADHSRERLWSPSTTLAW